MASAIHSKVILLLVINVILLIAGTFIDTTSALVLFTPLFLPMVQMYNIDRAQFSGLEANLSYSAGDFSLDADVTYYDRIRFCRPGENCIASSLASDYATNYIPPDWSANLSVNQKFLNDRAMLGARLTYMGDRSIGAEIPTAWPLFDACAGLPLCLVRGANSDLLGADAAAEMRARRPDMIFAEVPDRAHIPFLDEPEAVAALRAWLDLMR